jgi:hypothetical protein
VSGVGARDASVLLRPRLAVRRRGKRSLSTRSPLPPSELRSASQDSIHAATETRAPLARRLCYENCGDRSLRSLLWLGSPGHPPCRGFSLTHDKMFMIEGVVLNSPSAMQEPVTASLQALGLSRPRAPRTTRRLCICTGSGYRRSGAFCGGHRLRFRAACNRRCNGLEAFAPLGRDKRKRQRGSGEALAAVARPASLDRGGRFSHRGALKLDRQAVPLSREFEKVLTSWKNKSSRELSSRQRAACLLYRIEVTHMQHSNA